MSALSGLYEALNFVVIFPIGAVPTAIDAWYSRESEGSSVVPTAYTLNFSNMPFTESLSVTSFSLAFFHIAGADFESSVS